MISWDCELLYEDGVRLYNSKKLRNIKIMSDNRQIGDLVYKTTEGIIRTLISGYKVDHFSIHWLTISGYELGLDGQTMFKQVLAIQPAILEANIGQEKAEVLVKTELTNPLLCIRCNLERDEHPHPSVLRNCIVFLE